MIRKAEEKDITKIGDLLSQVDLVHHSGRPDIFKIGTKYSEKELEELRQTCDRIAIVSGGRISGILPASSSVEDLGMLMLSNVI